MSCHVTLISNWNQAVRSGGQPDEELGNRTQKRVLYVGAAGWAQMPASDANCSRVTQHNAPPTFVNPVGYPIEYVICSAIIGDCDVITGRFLSIVDIKSLHISLKVQFVRQQERNNFLGTANQDFKDSRKTPVYESINIENVLGITVIDLNDLQVF